ncbi:MAG TPA: PD-(D/E)XK nuclease-like domain-containing protein [Planctomycetota bacterium]|nr:PD-(D/E)XK nuclease-like domain-containing protein [Planctomycetota bacterium]
MIATMSDPMEMLIRESFEEYLEKAKTHLTSHALGDFRRCPLLYWKKKQGLIPDEDRPAFMVGRATHKLILEGQAKFAAEYAVGGPINQKTGRPYGANTLTWAEWAKAQRKPVLTGEQFELIGKMAEGVKAHQVACELLHEGVAEGVVRGEYCGLPAQARLDWLNISRGIIDLKTADNLDYFTADARRYGYVHQVAFYAAVLRMIAGEKLPAWFIAVEKQEPFRCGVWRVDDSILAHARKENEAAIERLKRHAAANEWPTGFESPLVIDSI